MADNAIEKLFEEMRAAAIEHEAAVNASREADARLIAAKKRLMLLDEALRKHIHEGMPIVQAKMIAHEEELNQPKLATATITVPQVVAGTIHAGNKGSIRRV